jgi:hypothetical protein
MMESQKVRKIDMFGIVSEYKTSTEAIFIDSCIRRNDSHVLFASLSYMY